MLVSSSRSGCSSAEGEPLASNNLGCVKCPHTETHPLAWERTSIHKIMPSQYFLLQVLKNHKGGS